MTDPAAPTRQLHDLLQQRPGPTPLEVRELVAQGADVTWAEPRRGTTALHHAARLNLTEVVGCLLELGADVNALCTQSEMSTALMACIGPRPDFSLPTVELLLDAGAEVDLPDSSGHTAIYKAISYKNLPVLERLIAAGAELNRSYPGHSIFGETAFSYAVAYWPEVMERLVEAGADPNAPQRNGVSCLWVPVFGPSPDVVRRLMALGADVDLPDDEGRTILARYAAFPRRCEPEMVALLLELGADPNHQDAAGRSALLEAVDRQEVEVVRLMLEHGGDPDLADAEGHSPRSQATTPLLLAALDAAPPVDLDDVTGLARAFLMDGLVFEHEGWSLRCHGGELTEAFPRNWPHKRRVSDTHADELLAWLLLHEDPATPALFALLDAGLDLLGLDPMDPEEARSRLLSGQPELVARVRLDLRPEHGGEVVAEALSAGLVLDYGDKEGWWRWSARPEGGFLYESANHNDAGGRAYDVLDAAGVIGRWARRFELRRGRLEAYHRRYLDQCLEHLGQPSVRSWLQAPDSQSSSSGSTT